MKVLVTGGAGFVGHAVVRAAAARGHDVRVLDPASAHPRWPEGVEHQPGGVLDPPALQRATRGVDVVFHVAGLWGEADAMRALNVAGTTRVLQTGLPVVYTSSSITCGYGPSTAPGTEDDPSEDPAHPIRGTGLLYRQTKLQAEALVVRAGGWIVNPDYVVGPGDRHGVVMGPLLRLARWRVQPVPRGGKCFVSVDDVGEGHLLAFERGATRRRYLLGAENRTYADVVATLTRGLGRRALQVHLPRGPTRWLGEKGGALAQMQLERYRDPRRAKTELGWTPSSVDDALLDAIVASTTSRAPRT